MRPDQLLIAHLTATLMGVAALGLMVRGRVRLCRSFLAYVLVNVACNRLIVHSPEQFHTWSFWTLKETAYTALKVAVACEIGWLAFRVLPRARHRAAVGLLVVLALT